MYSETIHFGWCLHRWDFEVLGKTHHAAFLDQNGAGFWEDAGNYIESYTLLLFSFCGVWLISPILFPIFCGWMEYGIVFRVTPSAKLREGFDLRYVVWSHQFFKIQGLHITAEQQEPISSKAVRWQSFWYIIFVDYKLYIYIYVMWTYPSTLHVYLISINDIQSVESYFIIYPGSKIKCFPRCLNFCTDKHPP